MPTYIDRGAEQVLRAPFLHRDVQLRMFALAGSRQHHQQIADRYLNRVSQGAVTYRAVGRVAMLTFATMPHIASLDPRDRDFGYAAEVDVALWIPLRRDRRLVWFNPYIIVDNPYAALIGREHYGFPKVIGEIQIPEDAACPHGHTVDVLTLGRHSPTTCASPGRLITVRPVAAAPGRDRASVRLSQAGVVAWQAAQIARGGAVEIVFLRQLRDAADPERAAFQEIIEAPARMTSRPHANTLEGAWEVDLPHHDSHPIARELGLREYGNPVHDGREVRFDFVMEKGERVWGSDPGVRAERRRPRIVDAGGGEAPKRAKIAILGGGVGGLTAALQLTREPDHASRYEITVYQKGWRLGGKGASGRNADVAQRIEEHGLHIWLGFYEQAFDLIRHVYDSLDRDPRMPLATWRDAFIPQREVVFHERRSGAWRPWLVRFASSDGEPGDGAAGEPAWRRAARIGRNLLATGLLQVEAVKRPRPSWAARTAAAGGLRSLERALAALIGLGGGPHGAWTELLTKVQALTAGSLERLLDDDDTRRTFVATDLALTMAFGIVRDDLLRRGFESIDHLELREWLRLRGASEETLRSPLLASIYDLTLAFRDGRVDQPDIAAGTALSGMLRMLYGYRGAIMWRMTASMGDAVIAPMYELLVRRGVRFEFFHRVEEITPSADGGRVEGVRLARQARVRGGTYQPLVRVGQLDAWPDRPLYEQLEEGESLRASGVDLEHDESIAAERMVLAAGRDFDAVVLAIPVAALPSLCPRIIAAQPSWRRMVEGVRTVATVGVQVWTGPGVEDMGWRRSGTDPTLAGALALPLSTWADMTLVDTWEAWPTPPGHIGYFCGPLEDDPDEPDLAHAAAREIADELLDTHLPGLWPGFDRTALLGAERDGDPDGLYLRVNTAPSERYVQSVAGSTRFRLAPDDTSLTNLVFAGDWTRNAVNAGCVEAAVTSAQVAVRAIAARIERGEIEVGERRTGELKTLRHPGPARRSERQAS